MRKDPKEMNNAYSDSAYKEIVADLKSQLKNLLQDLNETDEKYPHVQKIIDEHWNDG